MHVGAASGGDLPGAGNCDGSGEVRGTGMRVRHGSARDKEVRVMGSCEGQRTVRHVQAQEVGNCERHGIIRGWELRGCSSSHISHFFKTFAWAFG